MADTNLAASTPEQHPQHLEPSQLGTKEYWDNYYANSLEHLSDKHKRGGPRRRDYAHSDEGSANEDNDDDDDDDVSDVDTDSDPGTSWFTEHNAPEKVLDFMASPDFPLSPESQEGASIIDLGTGNGTMLALLRREGGFTGPMVGVDYSLQSVELARRLHADDDIRFEVWDVFDGKALEEKDWFPAAKGGFDIALDKGTFDAISLSADEVEVSVGGEKEKVRRRICEVYPEISRRVVRFGGYLIVTSCNWTEEELVEWFTRGQSEEDRLVVFDRIEYPKFRFGGHEGQGVCTVCFQRKGKE